ncbi:MAG TPA: ATP-binding protein [Solirubrobacteraceae bacterium]|nr:ATP-binding protein [Solirubrobacteraceae bacterium]
MRLRTGLLAALAYVVLLAILALGVPLALSLSTRVNDEVRSQAQGQADLVAATAADLLSPARRGELEMLARTAAGTVRGRVLVVDRSGIVLADSAEPAQLGVSYAARPEMASALAGHQVQVQRASRTLGEEILATAVPIIRERAPVGAVRVTQSVAAVHAAVSRVELGLALIGGIVLALGLAVGAVIAGQIARPLGRLELIARRVAGGDLSARAPIEGSREQRSLGESFNEMTDRVERLLSSQRAFVADASHQLRTPLTGLRLRIEEARAGGVGPAADAELDAGLAEVDRLAQMVDELLVLSRAGEREQPGEQLDLRVLVADALRRWDGAACEREIALAPGEACDGGAWCARADADRALDVLVENALRYSPRGSHVTISSGPGWVEVQDRGPGLAAGEGEELFERFHRGRAGRGGPAGSGLGLAIARELAREWGGEVTLRDRDGGGACARLSLPERRP